MNYRNKEGAAELGIKICDFTRQEKGVWYRIAYCFLLMRCSVIMDMEKMISDTNLKKRAGAACL